MFTPTSMNEALLSDPRRLAAESIGTFFLVLIGPGAAMVNAASNGAISEAESPSRSGSSSWP